MGEKSIKGFGGEGEGDHFHDLGVNRTAWTGVTRLKLLKPSGFFTYHQV